MWLQGLLGGPLLGELPAFQPRYNIAPSQPVLAASWDHQRQGIRLEYLRWGLVPSWADNPTIAHRLSNARWETLSEKLSFREPFRCGRCLVLADGYYEWQAMDRRRKQAFWIHRPDEAPLVMAGISACNQRIDPQHPLRTVAIVTCPSTPTLSAIHPRMPLILHTHQQLASWLAEGSLASDLCEKIFQPPPLDYFNARPVSDRVNRPVHDDPACLGPGMPSALRSTGNDGPVVPDI